MILIGEYYIYIEYMFKIKNEIILIYYLLKKKEK